MSANQKITIDVFKTVTKAIAQSDNLDTMTNNLARLLAAALEIKGCALFVLNLETRELETMASFGLTPKYLTKGPLNADRSFAENLNGVPVIVPDVSNDEKVQYPEEAKKEGIAAILSLPISFSNEILGVLRLYHHDVWHISDHDIDSLLLLAENIGLAMTYTRLLNAIQTIDEVVAAVSPTDSLPMPND